MPPKKDAKADAKGKAKAKPKAPTEGGGKRGPKKNKKKWSKGKVKDKLENKVILDKTSYSKVVKDVPTMKIITVSSVSERMKVNGSVARRVIRDLQKQNLIKPVSVSHAQLIYTRTK
eukprot:TRINITY_DN207_c0_g1_i1.p1 TRINITY_DN207_c0_g1~~TRINITY_DN207_c0_g1_i1.p1  ORF type:complete len:117 (-),score=29.63 TRINITY_DN207_c0_g1_i1:57-407(-)